MLGLRCTPGGARPGHGTKMPPAGPWRDLSLGPSTFSLFFFLFFSPGWSGRWDFFPSLAGTFTLVETVTAATPFSFFPKPQQLTERVRTLATGCCTLQTPVANCHLQFPESFASLAPLPRFNCVAFPLLHSTTLGCAQELFSGSSWDAGIFGRGVPGQTHPISGN